TCTMDYDCSHYGANGGTNDPCSKGATSSYPNGAGTNLSCPCSGSDVCSTIGAPRMHVTDGNTGTCCPPAWDGVSCGGSDGCGGTCGCAAGQFCNGGTCATDYNCAHYSANGNASDPCSTAASSSFPNGGGTNLTCPCGGSLVCATTGAPRMHVTG